MTGNDLGVIDIQTGEFGAFAGDELVARTVEAVFADAVFLVVLVGQGVHEVGCGKRLVERGVEYGYLFHAGKDFFDGEDAFEVGRIVQRGDLEQRADLLLDLFGYQTALREKFAAVRYAMTDGLHFVERPDYAVHGVGQGLKHQADARRVIGNRLVELELLLADGFVREIAFRKADALDQTFGEQFAGLGFHVDHLVFDRRTAAVEY